MKYCDTCRSAYPNEFNTCPVDQALLRATADLVPGMVLRGKYEVLDKVGAGGMAAVYRARHLAFGEVRAIKVVAARLCDDEGFVKRFRTEAVITRRLQHPHAVRVDDLDVTEDGRPFIVMEYVEGRSLGAVIRAEGALPVARAAIIGAQVASALAAAHALGITHRDIKPDNILITATPGGGDHAKVLDFGIAKVREGAFDVGPGYTPTETGMVVGTPQYMSPEQAMGKRGDELDGRSDLYSLGVALYQMITGRLPFESTTPMELILQHVRTPPPPPHLVRPDLALPAAVGALLMRALQKDPGLRFRSAEEMAAALTVLASLPAPAISPSRAGPALEGTRSAIATRGPGDATRPKGPSQRSRPASLSAGREEPAETERTSSTPALVASGLVILGVLGAVAWKSSARTRPPPTVETASPAAAVTNPSQVGASAAGDTDGQIQNEIQRLLVSSSTLRSHPIVVEVGNGIVTLSGSVGDATSSQLAEGLAASVAGVRRVFNTLRVPEAPGPLANVAGGRTATEEEVPSRPPRAAAGGAEETTVAQLVESAKRNMAAGKMAEALADCRAALQLQPHHFLARTCVQKVQTMGGGRRRP